MSNPKFFLKFERPPFQRNEQESNFMKFSIAKRIRELRRTEKLTQKQVAEKLFISQAAYSLIEKGQNCLGVEHVIRLSKMYDVTTDFILMGETDEVGNNDN